MNNTLQENIDYKFIIPENDEGIEVELLTGKFSGIIYRYGNLIVRENPDNPCDYLIDFKYDIIEYNGFDESTESNKEFKDIIGQVLTNMLHSLQENQIEIIN